ncbi:MAG: hypothetical protein IPK66_04780 [Rhodospirillales bacterium]|nr:hypothetical protein [Rhodospirillales bacterium]
MSSILRIAIIAVVVLLVAGVALLATVDLQPPTHHIEKVLPNEQFAH